MTQKFIEPKDEKQVAEWLAVLQRAGKISKGMGWYFTPVDYDSIKNVLHQIVNTGGNLQIALYNTDAVLYGGCGPDFMNPANLIFYEVCIRMDPRVKGVSHAIRERAMQIAGDKWGATHYIAYNAEKCRDPGYDYELERRIMVKHGWKPFCHTYFKRIP